MTFQGLFNIDLLKATPDNSSMSTKFPRPSCSYKVGAKNDCGGGEFRHYVGPLSRWEGTADVCFALPWVLDFAMMFFWE